MPICKNGDNLENVYSEGIVERNAGSIRRCSDFVGPKQEVKQYGNRGYTNDIVRQLPGQRIRPRSVARRVMSGTFANEVLSRPIADVIDGSTVRAEPAPWKAEAS
ncbi:hypothetical protein TNCV_2452111 [Trichonephila clavipes]|nr:hypothetical protein TNCV_2452111 [Trichonephila clavipes]